MTGQRSNQLSYRPKIWSEKENLERRYRTMDRFFDKDACGRLFLCYPMEIICIMNDSLASSSPWEVEQRLSAEARETSIGGLSTFLQKLSTAFPSSFFPTKITQELLHNPALSIADLISSSTSPALYKSILQHLEAVTAPIDATKETKDIGQILMAIASDPLFVSIDDSVFRSFASLVASKGQLSDLSAVRAIVLSRCTPPRFSLLNTQFIESVYQDILSEDVARTVMGNLLQTHEYPFFDKYRFLVRVLSFAGQQPLHGFLLKEFSSFISSPFQRADVLCAIAELAPYDFPVFYFKNRYRLFHGIDTKYSCATQAKQTHKLCFQRLTLMQKLLSGIPILL